MSENDKRKYWELVKLFGIQEAEDLEGSEWAIKLVKAGCPSDADAWSSLESFLGYPVSHREFLIADRVADYADWSLMDLPERANA